MKRVTVYYFEDFDKDRVTKVRSKRPATREAIERAAPDGKIIEGTAIEVDDLQLDGNGFLKIDA